MMFEKLSLQYTVECRSGNKEEKKHKQFAESIKQKLSKNNLTVLFAILLEKV